LFILFKYKLYYTVWCTNKDVFLNTDNKLVFAVEKHCVFYDVGNELVIYMNFLLQRI